MRRLSGRFIGPLASGAAGCSRQVLLERGQQIVPLEALDQSVGHPALQRLFSMRCKACSPFLACSYESNERFS